jgi:hypothetical protein
MYSSTLSLNSALDEVGGQRHAPAALPPGKTRYPLNRRLGGPQGRSGRVRKISPPQGFYPRTVQPVVSRYTDWAIPAHFYVQDYSVMLYFNCSDVHRVTAYCIQQGEIRPDRCVDIDCSDLGFSSFFLVPPVSPLDCEELLPTRFHFIIAKFIIIWTR